MFRQSLCFLAFIVLAVSVFGQNSKLTYIKTVNEFEPFGMNFQVELKELNGKFYQVRPRIKEAQLVNYSVKDKKPIVLEISNSKIGFETRAWISDFITVSGAIYAIIREGEKKQKVANFIFKSLMLIIQS